MRVCLIKLNGWPDAFDERIHFLTKYTDEILVIKPKSNRKDTELTEKFKSVEVVNLWPSRKPSLTSNYSLLFYPIWVIQAVVTYFIFCFYNESYDVLHAVDYPFSATATKVISNINQKPRISSVRGLQAARLSSELDKTIKSKILLKTFLVLIRHSLEGSDFIITKSEYQKGYIRDNYGIKNIPMECIPTGVDYNKFSPYIYGSDYEILDSLLTDEELEKKTLLHLGQLIPQKGLDKFVEHAIETDNSDVHFLAIGEFSDSEFKDRIINYITNNKGDKITIHSSYISFSKVPKLISEVDGVCLLSENNVEGVPRVLQEAVVMNTPIIASDVDGISKNFKSKDGCFLIDRTDICEFRNAIKYSFQESPNRDEFRHIFDIDNNYKRTVDIYKNAQN